MSGVEHPDGKAKAGAAAMPMPPVASMATVAIRAIDRLTLMFVIRIQLFPSLITPRPP
ncbi:hypothetical protein Q0Z83_101670 [Actinoplanes sichuanensis]|nr:hypothetical protein Q0Z83_101670 [Actinoplanes sichuanensis]